MTHYLGVVINTQYSLLCRFFADFLSVLSRTVNPHDPEKCNELNHFNKKEENHETDSDDDDKEKLVSKLYSRPNSKDNFTDKQCSAAV